MYRAEKASSRICRDRDVANAQRIHRAKIETVHPSIKTQPASSTRQPHGGNPLRTKWFKPSPTKHKQSQLPHHLQPAKASSSEYEDDFHMDMDDNEQEPAEEQQHELSNMKQNDDDHHRHHHHHRHHRHQENQQPPHHHHTSNLKLDDLRDASETIPLENDPIRIVPMHDSSSGSLHVNPPSPGSNKTKKSLHGSFRMKRLKEIEVDNLNLFQRIKKSTAHYDNAKMRQEWKQNVTYLQSISSYPIASSMLHDPSDSELQEADSKPSSAATMQSTPPQETLEFPSVHPIKVMPTSPKRPIVNLAPGFRSLRKAMPQQPSLPPLEMHPSLKTHNHHHLHQQSGAPPPGIRPTPPPPLITRGTPTNVFPSGDSKRFSTTTTPRKPPPLSSGATNNASLMESEVSGDQILKIGRFVEGHYLVLTVFRGDASSNPYGFDVLAVNPSLKTSYLLQITKQMTHSLLEQVGSMTCSRTLQAAGTNLSVEHIAKILSEQVHFTLLENGGEMFFLYCSGDSESLHHEGPNSANGANGFFGGHGITKDSFSLAPKHLLLTNKPASFVFCIRKEIEMLLPLIDQPQQPFGSANNDPTSPQAQASMVDLMIRNSPVLDSTRGDSCMVQFQLFEAQQLPNGSSCVVLPMTPEAMLARQITSIDPLTLQYEAICEFFAVLGQRSDTFSLEMACVSLINHMCLQKPTGNTASSIQSSFKYQLVLRDQAQSNSWFDTFVLQSGMIWKDSYFVIRAFTCDRSSGQMHDDIPVSMHHLQQECHGNLVVTMFLPQHNLELCKELTCQDLDLMLHKLALMDQKEYLELDAFVKCIIPFLDVQAQDFCTQTMVLDFPLLMVHESLVKLSPRQRTVQMTERNNASRRQLIRDRLSNNLNKTTTTTTTTNSMQQSLKVSLPDIPEFAQGGDQIPIKYQHLQNQQQRQESGEYDQDETQDQFVAKAATKIQARWRGFSTRRNTPLPTNTANAASRKPPVPKFRHKNPEDAAARSIQHCYHRFSIQKRHPVAKTTHTNGSQTTSIEVSAHFSLDSTLASSPLSEEEERYELLQDMEQDDDVPVMLLDQKMPEPEEADPKRDASHAAQLIQCHYRGFSCRKRLQAGAPKQTRHAAAKSEERSIDPAGDRAAIRIQSMYRGFSTRKYHPKEHRESTRRVDQAVEKAALRIQSTYRGFSFRKQHPTMASRARKATKQIDPPKEKAALRIQSTFRGFSCRKQHPTKVRKGTKRVVNPDMEKAALRIQSTFRGFACRKRRADRPRRPVSSIKPKEAAKPIGTPHETVRERHTIKSRLLQNLPDHLGLSYSDEILTDAAKSIQAHFRGYRVRRSVYVKAHGRGSSNGRQNLVLMVVDPLEETSSRPRPSTAQIAAAATRIQAQYRGFRVRKKYLVKRKVHRLVVTESENQTEPMQQENDPLRLDIESMAANAATPNALEGEELQYNESPGFESEPENYDDEQNFDAIDVEDQQSLNNNEPLQHEESVENESLPSYESDFPAPALQVHESTDTDDMQTTEATGIPHDGGDQPPQQQNQADLTLEDSQESYPGDFGEDDHELLVDAVQELHEPHEAEQGEVIGANDLTHVSSSIATHESSKGLERTRHGSKRGSHFVLVAESLDTTRSGVYRIGTHGELSVVES